MQPNPFARHFAIVERCLPFTAEDGQAFVRLPVPTAGGFSTLPVRSPAFRDWFFYEFSARHDSLPTSRQFPALLNYLEARANYYEAGNLRLAVFRRVGRLGKDRHPDQILLDLANPAGQVVEISATGWKTTAGPGVLLQTSRSTRSILRPEPCPEPQARGPRLPL